MVESGWSSGTRDAIRLGNGLMDAGLLHHVHHSHPFENGHFFYSFHDLHSSPYVMAQSRYHMVISCNVDFSHFFNDRRSEMGDSKTIEDREYNGDGSESGISAPRTRDGSIQSSELTAAHTVDSTSKCSTPHPVIDY